ncbi:hypothetical protein DFR29_12347 [Tahibacter aquaticus]|uniref:Uncharacterized protein n=2 Tax=Tahibacter aquaticus TaxID=520092 RepID=A0A4R6YLC5_9GAMM|nr:hypothetical protein DFR29_12347 [Tahibacter aquaticus]
MNKAIFYFAAIAALFVVYFVYRNDVALTQPATTAAGPTPAHVPTPPASTGMPASVPPLSPRASGVAAFLNAADTQAALEVQQRLAVGHPPLAAEMAAELGDACYRVSVEGSLIAKTPGNQWVLDRIKQYCSGYRSDTPAIELRKRALAVGSRAAVEKQLADIETKDGVDAAKREAEQIILAAADPYSMDEARLYLARQPGGWSLGATLPESTLTGVNRDTAQGLAAKMYECEAFGGCGPNALQTLTWCAQYEVCQPGFGLLDLLRATNKPANFTAAEKILIELRRQRQAYGR